MSLKKTSKLLKEPNFQPNYQITPTLLANIKKITLLVHELNQVRLPEAVRFNYEKASRAVSAHASTSIEGNQLPLTVVKNLLKSSSKYQKNSELEVSNYNLALEEISQNIKQKTKFSLTNVLKIHRLVIKDLIQKDQVGKIRKFPVVVNNPKTGKLVFMPPNYQEVEKLLQNLTFFINQNQEKLDPLILAGIFHKQFILIHPFIDGNGRTTRLLTTWLLSRLGLRLINLFSFENYYNQNVSRYFEKVGERGDYYDVAGELDFTTWLEYFVEGILEELLRVKKTLPKFIFNPALGLKSHHQKIITKINQDGYISDVDYREIVERSKAARTKDFAKLIELDLIQRKGKGKSTFYTLADR